MIKQRSLLKEHWAEASLAGVTFIATLIALALGKISKDTTLVIDVVIPALAINVAILKGYFAKTAESLAVRRKHIESKSGAISSILEALSGADFDHAIRIVDTTIHWLTDLRDGKLRLEANLYYAELARALRECLRRGLIS
jgi:hypothetical protein